MWSTDTNSSQLHYYLIWFETIKFPISFKDNKKSPEYCFFSSCKNTIYQDQYLHLLLCWIADLRFRKLKARLANFLSDHNWWGSVSTNHYRCIILVRHCIQQKGDTFLQSYLSKAIGLMGMKPLGDTRASTGTSPGVTGMDPSSIICTEYDNATATKQQRRRNSDKYIELRRNWNFDTSSKCIVNQEEITK